jgi:hypothetical protein
VLLQSAVMHSKPLLICIITLSAISIISIYYVLWPGEGCDFCEVRLREFSTNLGKTCTHDQNYHIWKEGEGGGPRDRRKKKPKWMSDFPVLPAPCEMRPALSVPIYEKRSSENGPHSFFERKKWQDSVSPVLLHALDACSCMYKGVVTSLDQTMCDLTSLGGAFLLRLITPTQFLYQPLLNQRCRVLEHVSTARS